MENLNTITLFGIFISSIVNIAVELEDKHTIKHELQLKLVFCCIAVLSFYFIFNEVSTNLILFYVPLLYILIIRIIDRVQHLRLISKKY
jgi:hypothetical protein